MLPVRFAISNVVDHTQRLPGRISLTHAPWTGLEDLIRHCAATQHTDLRDFAILVPDCGAGAVVVLVRHRRRPFRRRDLSRAVAWLSDHRPDGAAEPLVVEMAPHM
jgi:hypothetical protein